jgi:uncharacterized RDD family membrane protein YckC
MIQGRNDPWTDTVVFATPEGVAIELTLAGLGSRMVATAIDSAVQVGVQIALFVLLIGSGEQGSGPGIALFSILSFLAFFGYGVLFETLASGRTPGKRVTGLRVIRSGGRPVGFTASAIRNLVRLVDFLPFSYAVGILFVLFTRNNQRLGDLAADTLVVRERTGDRTEPTTSSPTYSGELVDWDVSAIDGPELAMIRRFLERRSNLSDDARRALARDLAARLRPKVAGASQDVTNEAFLERVADAKAARL